jgi:GntR family transcriptional repressor for pyruvate dehydrogenase complex
MATGLNKIVIAQPESVASEVLKRLLEYLFSGEVEPGQRIPSERQLTESLGVNRPAVREAVRALAFLGLLDIRQGSGTYFRDPDQDLLFTLFELSLTFGQRRLHDLVEARGELEVLVAGLAADRRTDEDVEELRGLLADMRRATGSGFAETDLAFHGKIAEAARNGVLQDMLKGVRTMVRGWVISNVTAAGSTTVMYNDHVPIFAAIAAGDVDAARKAMAAHMTGARGRLAPEFFEGRTWSASSPQPQASAPESLAGG